MEEKREAYQQCLCVGSVACIGHRTVGKFSVLFLYTNCNTFKLRSEEKEKKENMQVALLIRIRHTIQRSLPIHRVQHTFKLRSEENEKKENLQIALLIRIRHTVDRTLHRALSCTKTRYTIVHCHTQ